MAGLVFNIFGRDVSASAALRRIQGQASRSAAGIGGHFRRMGGVIAGGFAAAGIGSFIKDSVRLEAEFSGTMGTLQAATNATAEDMKQLNDLAMELGANTKFSANEAADAMLELSKAGISTKEIMSGAADGTLLLATAGGTDLANAATIASNAMNTFNLKGADMGKIAAALAGGANASSASVDSLGQALQQVGPGATNAGLSLQETVGALAAFDAAGIKGSDAGTSLKTMLARLVPSTDAAKGAMEDLNLNFVNADGSFKSITEVAEQLHDRLGDLSAAQRTTALQTIFGSDATRAATVLMNEGSKGLAEYIKATKDQGAAQRMADAAMSGTGGALEQLSGAVDTLKLQVGMALAPVVTALAKFLSNDLIPAISATISWMQDHGTIVKTVAIAIGVLVTALLAAKVGLAAYNIVQGIAAVLAGEQAAATGLQTLALGAQKVALATSTAAQWLFNAAMRANPIGLVITAIAALAAGFVIAYKKSETFRNIVQDVWDLIKKVGRGIHAAVAGIVRAFKWVGEKVAQFIGPVLDMLREMKELAEALTGWFITPGFNNVIAELGASGGMNSGSSGAGPGFGRQANAQGTGFFRGGWTRINERGHESVMLPGGSKIYPASMTASKMRGGGVTELHVHIDGPALATQADIGRAVSKALEYAVQAGTKVRIAKGIT